MAIEITMPKLSDTMEEGTILQWRVSEGDKVTRGDIIAEVETDKAAMEMEAYEDGVVSELRVGEGETVEVGSVIAVFNAVGPVEEEAAEEEAAEEEAAEERGAPVSPAARRLAKRLGIDPTLLRGTGPGGRVVSADVEAAAEEVSAAMRAEKAIPGGGKSVKIRRIVARKMTEAWKSIPHFFVTVAVDMTDVIRFRKDIGYSINDFIIAATARSLREHPWVNSHWVDGEAVEQEQINIAMAVATDRGLYNPVVRDCAGLSLKAISARAKTLVTKAHQGRLNEEDMKDGTFTISNMGMLGVESFSAIITPPQAAVLAVGTVKGEVVVDEKEEPGIAPILRLTLSADHRILDGADAAEFLTTLKSYIEAPVTLVGCRKESEEE